MDENRSLYRREGGTMLIELRLSRIQQVFDTLDPAPFPERSLDNEVENYIVSSASDIPIHELIKLVFYLPADQFALDQTTELGGAIHNYFDYRLAMAQRQLRHQRREGRVTLAIGLPFLFTFISLRQLLFAFDRGTVAQIIAEGLLISGWVAMWQPLSLLLYEWWPIRRSCTVFAKLAKVPVEVRPVSVTN